MQGAPAGEDVGQVVLRVVGGGERGPGHWAELFRREEFGAFVVERHAIGVHVVEPDVVRAAGVGLGEEEDGGGDASVGLEHATGQGDDGVEFLFLDEELAQGLVRVGRAEEDAVGHDDGGASAGLEQAQEEGEEEQLRLLVGGGGKTGEKRRFEIPLGERVFERGSPISVASWVKSRVCEHGSQVLLRECCVRLSKLVG